MLADNYSYELVIRTRTLPHLDAEGSQLWELVQDSTEVVRLPLGVRVVGDVVS